VKDRAINEKNFLSHASVCQGDIEEQFLKEMKICDKIG